MIVRSFFDDAPMPELELRALTPRGLAVSQRVRDHLTIGSSVACELIVDDDEAACIHAIVYPSDENGWELRGVGSSTMLMWDGQIASTVRLADGVVFLVGKTRIRCVEIPVAQVFDAASAARACDGDMGDPPMPPEMPPEAEHEAHLKLIERAASAMGRCPSCWKSLAGLAPIARFCPKCGGKLPAMDVVPPVDEAALEPMYQELRLQLDAKLAEAPSSEASRLMVLAYASALLNLGWRYEHGAGGSRNLPEAARCYAKAERLARAGEAV